MRLRSPTIRLKPFWELSEDEWDMVLRVNVRGGFQVTKGVLPSMRKRGRGIPVVFITAHDDLARRADQRTLMPVLRKPIDENDLLDAIAQVTAPAESLLFSPLVLEAPVRGVLEIPPVPLGKASLTPPNTSKFRG